jgi:hypothetical protein
VPIIWAKPVNSVLSVRSASDGRRFQKALLLFVHPKQVQDPLDGRYIGATGFAKVGHLAFCRLDLPRGVEDLLFIEGLRDPILARLSLGTS